MRSSKKYTNCLVCTRVFLTNLTFSFRYFFYSGAQPLCGPWSSWTPPTHPPTPPHTHTHKHKHTQTLTHTHTSIFEPNKVQQFQFQTSVILLFMGVQKLYGPEISWFLHCMLQFLDNSRRLFISTNYIRGKDYFTLDFLKSFSL